VQAFAERMISALSKANVEFVVVGGLSAVLQGVPIVTQDLDICYRRTSENMSRLAAALVPFHPRLRGLSPDVPNIFDARSLHLGMNFTLEIDDESLDVLGQMSAIGGYDEIVDRAEQMELAGHKIKILSLADLIATKRAAGRAKDLAVMPLLEATLQLRREMSEDE
jgi:hypothetical protein